jgi:phytoene synthase
MSFDACAELVQRGDPDRFLSAMTARPVDRPALMALYAFNLEVARAPWVTQEEMIAEMRLQWWADAIEEIFSDRQPRGHEVVTPLAQVIRERGLRRDAFAELVRARRFDIYRDAHADRADFDKYLDATSGGLMWLAAQALAAEPRMEPEVRRIGYAAGLASLLAATPALVVAGKRPLPDTSAGAVADVARTGLERLNDGRAFHKRYKALRPATLAAWRARRVLTRATQSPHAVLRGEVDMSEAARKLLFIRRYITGTI